jgi:hypothetical protein
MIFPFYSCVLHSNSRNPTHDYDSILPAGKIPRQHPYRQKGAYIRLLPGKSQADLCGKMRGVFMPFAAFASAAENADNPLPVCGGCGTIAPAFLLYRSLTIPKNHDARNYCKP